MIPHTIHMIWINPPLPHWVACMIERWQSLNPSWEVRLHGEEILAPEYTALYNRITDVCSRSDLLRLSVLRRYGGWYFDSDFIPFKPLDHLYEKYSIEDIFLTQQWPPGKPIGRKFVANGIFAITIDSPLWVELDKLVEETIVGNPDGLLPQGELERTSFGPLLTTALVRRHSRIPLSEIREFYPHRPPRIKCIERLITIWKAGFSEEAIASTGAAGSTAAHMWLGGDYVIPELDELAIDNVK